MDTTGLGMLPPQVPEIEEAVLGALLLEKDAYQLVCSILKPDHFYKEAHQNVYKAIVSLEENDSVVDMLTVVQELKRKNILEEVGGAFYVSQLTSKVASAAHVEHHAKVIFDKYVRRQIILKANELNAKAYDESVDLEDIQGDISDLDNNVFSGAGSGDMKTLKEVNDQALDEIVAIKEKRARGESVSIDTPLQGLNRIIGGFMPVDFVIIAARPADGKTAYALACAKHQALNGYKPAFFSLEMPGVQLSKRLFCAEAGVDSVKLKTGDISDVDLNKIKEAKRDLDKLGIYVSDAFSNSVAQIKASARKLINKGLCHIIYIDYIQLMEGSGNNRQEEVSGISRQIKKMAKELNIPVVAMAQLSRATEKQTGNPRPKLGHLRESGSLEQDADIIMFLFRPAKHGLIDERTEQPYSDLDVEVIVEKHRSGPTGIAHAETNKNRNTYYDRDTKTYQEPAPFVLDNGKEDSFADLQQSFDTGPVGRDRIFDE